MTRNWEFTPAEDEEYYPDVVLEGGIAGALLKLAEKSSLQVGEVAAPFGLSPFDLAELRDGRRTFGISRVLGRRLFSVSIFADGHIWARGTSGDLSEIVRAAAHWRVNPRIADFVREHQFMNIGDLAEAYENGTEVSPRWASLLSDPDLSDFRQLLEMLRADELVGQTFPSVSHFTDIRLEVDSKDSSAGAVVISRSGNSGYMVSASWAPESSSVDHDKYVPAAVKMFLQMRQRG